MLPNMLQAPAPSRTSANPATITHSCGAVTCSRTSSRSVLPWLAIACSRNSDLSNKRTSCSGSLRQAVVCNGTKLMPT